MVDGKIAAKKTRNRFTIPVFPHVKKFILKKYRLTNPIKTEETTSFGKSITLVLTKEQSEFGPRQNKLIRINQAMDDAFKEHLLTWVGAQQEAGIPAYAACKMFLQFYDIDEKEYTLDAAYRLWQRSK